MADHKHKKLNRANVGVRTDRFKMIGFDHMEFYAADAKSAMKTLKLGIGMEIIGQSMHETGNHIYQSYVLKTGNIKWIVTAPYLSEFKHPKVSAVLSHPPSQPSPRCSSVAVCLCVPHSEPDRGRF